MKIYEVSDISAQVSNLLDFGAAAWSGDVI